MKHSKTCSRCGENKLTINFSKCGIKLHPWCKSCRAEYNNPRNHVMRVSTDRVMWEIIIKHGTGETFKTAEVVSWFPQENPSYTNVLNCLEMLRAEGLVNRVRRGVYTWNGGTERPNKVLYALSRALECDGNYILIGVNTLEMLQFIRRFLSECGTQDVGDLIGRISYAMKEIPTL